MWNEIIYPSHVLIADQIKFNIYGYVIPSHSLLGMWLLIHTELLIADKVKLKWWHEGVYLTPIFTTQLQIRCVLCFI